MEILDTFLRLINTFLFLSFAFFYLREIQKTKGEK